MSQTITAFTDLNGKMVIGDVVAELNNVYIVDTGGERVVVRKDPFKPKPKKEKYHKPKKYNPEPFRFADLPEPSDKSMEYVVVTTPDGQTVEGWGYRVVGDLVGLNHSVIRHYANSANRIKLIDGKYKDWIFERVLPK